MTKQITPEIAAIFSTLEFASVDPAEVMTDWWPHSPPPEEDIPAIFYHDGIDAYFAYAPEIIDGMWDYKLQELGTIAVVDDNVSDDSAWFRADFPLQLIKVKDLSQFVAQYDLNPAYFESLVAKRGDQTLNTEVSVQTMAVAQVSMELWRAEEAASLAHDAYLRKIRSYERRHGPLKERLSAEAPEHAAVREFTAEAYKTHQTLKRQVYAAKRRLKKACLTLTFVQDQAAQSRQQAAPMIS